MSDNVRGASPCLSPPSSPPLSPGRNVSHNANNMNTVKAVAGESSPIPAIVFATLPSVSVVMSKDSHLSSETNALLGSDLGTNSIITRVAGLSFRTGSIYYCLAHF